MNEERVYIEATVIRVGHNCPKPIDGWFSAQIEFDNPRFGSGKPWITGHSHRIKVGARIEGDVHRFYDAKYRQVKYIIRSGDQPLIYCVDKKWLLSYLSGPHFPGIGAVKANRLWDVYGAKCISVIKNNRDEVQKTCKLSDKDMAVLTEGIVPSDIRSRLEREFPHLSKHALDKILKDEIFGKNFKAIHDTIMTNPYLLIEKDLMTFAKVDILALEDVCLPPDHPTRRSYLFLQSMKKMQEKLNSVCLLHSNSSKDNVWMTDFNGSFEDCSQFKGWYYTFGKLYTAGNPNILPPDLNQFNEWIWADVNSDKGFLYRERYPDYISDESKKKTLYYLKKMRLAESNVLGIVLSMLRRESDSNFEQFSKIMKNGLGKWLKTGLDDTGPTYDALMDRSQKEALYHILSHPLSILTGGPGRGKSRTIGNLVRFWQSQGFPVLVYAPTGKAVNRLRMESDAGCEMTETVSRCLYRENWRKTRDDYESDTVVDYEGNVVRLRPHVLVIVDESSMIGLEDGSRFLQLFSNCHIVFCGDDNQLPSVAPGAFFHDLLEGGVPVTELTINHRTEFPKILENADAILESDNEKNRRYRYRDHYGEEFRLEPVSWNVNRTDQLQKTLLSHYDHALNDCACTISDILCITPVNKDVYFLNYVLQGYFNPEREYRSRQNGGSHPMYRNRIYDDRRGRQIPVKDVDNKNNHKYDVWYRIGDRVMNIKNDPDWECYSYDERSNKVVTLSSGIFNGDMGTLTAVVWKGDSDLIDYFVVRFDDGRLINVSFDAFKDRFKMSYALTVHKVQGCEARFVFLIVSNDNKFVLQNGFLNKKLFYTAITRAKENVIVMGDTGAFVEGVGIKYDYKNDFLKDRLSYQILNLQKERGDFNGRWHR